MYTFREFSAFAKKAIEDGELAVARPDLQNMYEHLTREIYEPNRTSQGWVVKMACLLQEADVEAQSEGAYERVALVAAHEVAWKAYEALNQTRLELALEEIKQSRRQLLVAYGNLLVLPEDLWEGIDPEHDHINQLLIVMEQKLRQYLTTGEWLQPDTIAAPEEDDEGLRNDDAAKIAGKIMKVAYSILHGQEAPSNSFSELETIARSLMEKPYEVQHAKQSERGSGS